MTYLRNIWPVAAWADEMTTDQQLARMSLRAAIEHCQSSNFEDEGSHRHED